MLSGLKMLLGLGQISDDVAVFRGLHLRDFRRILVGRIGIAVKNFLTVKFVLVSTLGSVRVLSRSLSSKVSVGWDIEAMFVAISTGSLDERL